jgi:hypothetical protein
MCFILPSKSTDEEDVSALVRLARYLESLCDLTFGPLMIGAGKKE